MTISFVNNPGGLFNRIGKVGALVKNLKSYQSTQLTAMTDTTTGVVAQLDAESDVQAIMGSNYIGILSATDSVVSGVVQNLAAAIVNRMVFRDNPQLNQNLTSSNTLASIYQIIQQMEATGTTVLSMTVAASLGSFALPSVGNGQINVSVKRPFDGKTLENSFAENITFTCTQDSYIGGAIEGNEGFFVSGAGNQPDFFAFDWPLGSNGSVNINAIDGNVSIGSDNVLTNSGFADWTSNVPDNWDLIVGTAGTDILEQTTIIYSGDASCEFVGDGVTLTQINQEFNSSSGTSTELTPITQYSVCLWARRDGTAPSQGVLEIALIDENGNYVQDEAGVDNKFTIDLTLLSTSFVAYTGIFRTPLVLPDTVYLTVRQTTALQSGRSVYIANLGQGLMTQLYTSGPYVAIHSGSIPFNTNDQAIATVTNSRGAAGTLSTFQTLWLQLFSGLVLSNEILLPSASSPSVSDNLIQ